MIATPDHWHAPAAIAACAAGKHVYVEKPCSHNAEETLWLVEAARKHGRVVQHGTQRRSWPAVQEAIAKLHGGIIIAKELIVLETLDDVPWAELEHAYGSAADVPDLLRRLLDPDPKVRSDVLWTLYGNIFHQGTRYPATPYAIPFLIEMCADPAVPNRGDLLRFWGSLITGYFSVQERPCWGDGEQLHFDGEVHEGDHDEPYARALHQIYVESLKEYDLVVNLLASEEVGVRVGAAWLLACLPTKASESVPSLEARLGVEPSGWVRAAIAFALGEVGAPGPLRRILKADDFPAAQCMAACELARNDPSEELVEPLLRFIAEPIDGYEDIPGAGGKSTGDAAFSICHLPPEVRRRAIPAICDRLDHARSFDTMPLVEALLSAAFSTRDEPLTELTALQRHVLARMVDTEELWSIGNLMWTLEAYGLPRERDKCGKLIGVNVANDASLAELRSALAFAEMGFLEKARTGIRKSLEMDPAVIERAPAPDECWLLTAKAFAETDPTWAVDAYRRACAINPAVRHRVNPTWRLADLLNDEGLD